MFAIVKIIAPYLPHITEEIYQNYFKQFNSEISIHKFAFPEAILNITNSDEIISEFEKISEIIENVRRFKTEKQISM
ncbi:class I tRNA ligase family protein [bacterium]|nr:class I tRNA ligase family protein [bacterium]